jgi:hypothetical protein
MGERSGDAQKVDSLTLIGLVLLLYPLLTMLHELGGHGGACLLTGGTLTELGTHHVDCASTSVGNMRIVSCAGAAIDLIIGAVCYLSWRVARRPLLRTALWMAAVMKLLLAAGYPLFSGIINVGDFSIGAGRPLGQLPAPADWRVGFTLVGIAGYVLVVLLARRMLRYMLGDGEPTLSAQRRIAMTLYIVSGAVTLLSALPGPAGRSLVLSSAATFGGLAGLFSIAFRRPHAGEPKPFIIDRNWPLIVAGVVVTILFVAVLGPSIPLV